MTNFFPAVAVALFSLISAAVGQQPGASRDQIYSALRGEWTGTLQYRDSQSNKRVVLPTWLEVIPIADGKALDFVYTYDDGPTKTVTEKSSIAIDEAARSLMMTSDRDKSVERYGIDVNQQRGKRIELTLSGSGRESNRAVEVRITLKIDRNLYQFTKETRAQGEPFEFRDGYTLTRRNP